jgi:DNA-binding response OmpR family regulator
MKAKILILMKDEKYLLSLKKFLLSKIEESEVTAVADIKTLSQLTVSEYSTIIVSSALKEGTWMKALPIIKKVKSFILLGVSDGADVTESIAVKYGADAFFKLPVNSDTLLAAVKNVIEKAEKSVKIPDIMTRDFIETVRTFFLEMNGMNYYEFFGIEKNADIDEIKRKYISLARKYHPDKFRNVPSELRNMVYEITKRANEAYSVINHPNRRVLYDKMIAEKPETKRFDFRMRVAYEENLEDTIENPQARRFARLAAEAMKQKDYKSALTQLKMAASMEKNNSYLEKLMKEAEEGIKQNQ